MTHHLTPQEFVDALEGALAPNLRSHVERCERCRSEVAEMRRLMTSVEATSDFPEPSPLFWDHFSKRVQAATRVDASQAARSWGRTGWRPFVAVGSVFAAIVLAVIVGNQSTQPTPDRSVTTASASFGSVADLFAPVADEESLNFVAQAAASMPYEEFQQAAQPSIDATNAMVEQLTPRERAELVRLLKAHIRSDN